MKQGYAAEATAPTDHGISWPPSREVNEAQARYQALYVQMQEHAQRNGWDEAAQRMSDELLDLEDRIAATSESIRTGQLQSGAFVHDDLSVADLAGQAAAGVVGSSMGSSLAGSAAGRVVPGVLKGAARLAGGVAGGAALTDVYMTVRDWAAANRFDDADFDPVAAAVQNAPQAALDEAVGLGAGALARLVMPAATRGAAGAVRGATRGLEGAMPDAAAPVGEAAQRAAKAANIARPAEARLADIVQTPTLATKTEQQAIGAFAAEADPALRPWVAGELGSDPFTPSQIRPDRPLDTQFEGWLYNTKPGEPARIDRQLATFRDEVAPNLFPAARGVADTEYAVGTAVQQAIQKADEQLGDSLGQVFEAASARRDLAPQVAVNLQRGLAEGAGVARPASEETLQRLPRAGQDAPPAAAPRTPYDDIRSRVLFPTTARADEYSPRTVEAYTRFEQLQSDIASGTQTMLDRRTGRRQAVPLDPQEILPAVERFRRSLAAAKREAYDRGSPSDAEALTHLYNRLVDVQAEALVDTGATIAIGGREVPFTRDLWQQVRSAWAELEDARSKMGWYGTEAGAASIEKFVRQAPSNVRYWEALTTYARLTGQPELREMLVAGKLTTMLRDTASTGGGFVSFGRRIEREFAPALRDPRSPWALSESERGMLERALHVAAVVDAVKAPLRAASTPGGGFGRVTVPVGSEAEMLDYVRATRAGQWLAYQARMILAGEHGTPGRIRAGRRLAEKAAESAAIAILRSVGPASGSLAFDLTQPEMAGWSWDNLSGGLSGAPRLADLFGEEPSR